MTSKSFSRLELLVGEQAMANLENTRVIIFGVGGVGSWTAESLVRSGVGHITLVDCDRVDITNINRQMPATISTVGMIKTDVVRERLLAINPSAEVVSCREYYTAETAGEFNIDEYDYVVDAIDSLSDKALLIINATHSKAKLFSSMGAALKMDPSKISVSEFWKVNGCPLAAALRRKFKKTGIFPSRKFKCVYSPEIYKNRGAQPSVNEHIHVDSANLDNFDLNAKKAQINGTIAHTTAIFGFTLAGLIMQDILAEK